MHLIKRDFKKHNGNPFAHIMNVIQRLLRTLEL